MRVRALLDPFDQHCLRTLSPSHMIRHAYTSEACQVSMSAEQKRKGFNCASVCVQVISHGQNLVWKVRKASHALRASNCGALLHSLKLEVDPSKACADIHCVIPRNHSEGESYGPLQSDAACTECANLQDAAVLVLKQCFPSVLAAAPIITFLS